MEGCQMVWRNGWYRQCFLQEAMCAAQSRALSFWTLNFLSIFSRLLDVLEIVFLQVHLSVSAHRYFFPEKPLQDNRESYARKGYWRKWRKGFSYRNILKFRQFLMQFCYFCTEKDISKSWKSFLKRSKSVDLFSRIFLTMTLFAAETSQNCFPVTYNFCSFRCKRAFSRPWVARYIKEKLFVISVCTFVLIFFFFKKSVPPRGTWSKSILGCFFSESFYLSGKICCRRYRESFPSTVCNFPEVPRNYSEVLLDRVSVSWNRIFRPRRFDFQVCDKHKYYFQNM